VFYKPVLLPIHGRLTNFVKPDKRNLITYELLVRDFGDARNYQMLIDTISYFKRLGINAIELMPVNEFSGNESWGYNPTFYLALDKAYGTKNKFKEFIDLCHKNGIAVILDVVYNQLDAYNAPQGKLYWDAVNNRPAADNPWLNPDAPHPTAFSMILTTLPPPHSIG
jgi:glycosidase